MEGVRLRLPSRRGDGDRVSLFPMDPFLRPLHPLSARRNAVVLPVTISWHRANEEEESNMQVSQHFENWDNFVNKCSVCLHAVDGKGTILWANNPELEAMGYEPDEYIGRFIGDFHVDQDVIQDILARLTRDETLNAYPARLRAKDGSTKYVMINSNVYHEKGGEFGHTRCFTTEIGEAAWKALKSNK
jgi:PAS domain S-box-containing protein